MKDSKPRILTLILDKENFELIKSGKKKEDYRADSDFYARKLCNIKGNDLVSLKKFDLVKFSLGYTNKNIMLQCKGVFFDIFENYIPEGFLKGDQCYTIELGDIVEINV